MITLQADPLIEWDETITNLYAQSEEARNWVDANLLNLQSVDTNETIVNSQGTTWERIATQTFSNETLELVVTRVYRDNDGCAMGINVFNLTEI